MFPAVACQGKIATSPRLGKRPGFYKRHGMGWLSILCIKHVSRTLMAFHGSFSTKSLSYQQDVKVVAQPNLVELWHRLTTAWCTALCMIYIEQKRASPGPLRGERFITAMAKRILNSWRRAGTWRLSQLDENGTSHIDTYSMFNPCVQSLQAWYQPGFSIPSSDIPRPAIAAVQTSGCHHCSGCQVVADRFSSFVVSFAWAEFLNSSKFIEELRQNRIAPVPMGAGCPRVSCNNTFVAETLETLSKDTSQRWWSTHIWLQLRFDEYVWRYASAEQEFLGFNQ